MSMERARKAWRELATLIELHYEDKDDEGEVLMLACEPAQLRTLLKAAITLSMTCANAPYAIPIDKLVSNIRRATSE